MNVDQKIVFDYIISNIENQDAEAADTKILKHFVSGKEDIGKLFLIRVIKLWIK